MPVSVYYVTLTKDSNHRFSAGHPKIYHSYKEWTEFSNTYKNSVILSQDRITQLKKFHHSHLIPIYIG